MKKNELKKENSKKIKENVEELKSKKISVLIDLRKKSKKKLIESPEKRIIRYSNIVNNNINILSNNKSFAKKNKKSNE